MKLSRIQSIVLSIPLWILTGCESNNDAAVAKARAEADAAKAQLTKLQSSIPQAPLKCMVTGELFAKTGGGDIKKAAALSVRFVRLTPELQNLIASSVTAIKELRAQIDAHNVLLMEKYPSVPVTELTSGTLAQQLNARKVDEARNDARYREQLEWYGAHIGPVMRPILTNSQNALRQGAIETTTNSDGRFSLELDHGKYLMLTDSYTIFEDEIIWQKIITISSPNVTLHLDQKSAVINGKWIGSLESFATALQGQ